jgi:predicted dehydrogenase/acetyltransferase-like isoleucine patch superfamily enzyme
MQPSLPPPAVAVVGAGHWGQNLVRNMAELGALAALVEADPARAAALAQRHGVPARRLEEVLADPAIAALLIATPAATHGRLALRALEAGKDVFVEKPLALDLGEAAAVVRTAERLGRVAMVGHLLQYHPAFLRLRELVAAGRLGRLLYLYSHRLNLGRFRREENVFWSFAPHDLSMILALAGEEPDRITATGQCYLHERIADVTTTHLRFPSGIAAHVFVSWLHPFKEQRLIVVGDAGMAVFDDGRPWAEKLVLYPHAVRWRDGLPLPDRAEAVPEPLAPAEPLRLECEHFLAAVRSRARPRTDAAEGLRVLRVLAAAEHAARDGWAPGPAPGMAGSAAAAGIHPSAVIDPGCVIGPGTRIWHFSHVLAGARIGPGCTIGQNVMIGPDVVVGARCKIQNNVSLYQGVLVEDEVFLGPSCVFTNVRNPRAAVERKSEFRPTVVRRGATVGANATIVCGVEIGPYAFVGAGAVVTRDVPAHALVTGNPARVVGWMSHDGERLGEDLVCPRSGRRYALADGRLVEVVRAEESSAA